MPGHRPTIYDEPMERKQIPLPPHLIEYARELADGTLAKGVRQCIEESMDREENVKNE